MYFTMVIILFNTGLYKPTFSTNSFGKLVFLSFCDFLFSACSVSNSIMEKKHPWRSVNFSKVAGFSCYSSMIPRNLLRSVLLGTVYSHKLNFKNSLKFLEGQGVIFC